MNYLGAKPPAKPGQRVSFRLDADDLAALDEIVRRNKVSRNVILNCCVQANDPREHLAE